MVEEAGRDFLQRGLGERRPNIFQFGVLGEDILVHVGDASGSECILDVFEHRAVVEDVGRDFRDISAGIEHAFHPDQLSGISKEAFGNLLQTGLGEHFVHVRYLGESAAVVRGNSCKALAVLEGTVKFGEAQLAPVVDLLYHVSIVRTIVIAIAQAGNVTPDGNHIAVLVSVGMLGICGYVAQLLYGTVAPVHLDIRSALDRKDGFVVHIAVGVGFDGDGHHEGLDIDTGLGDHDIDGLDVLLAVTGGNSHDRFAGLGVSIVLTDKGEFAVVVAVFQLVLGALDLKPVGLAFHDLVAPVVVGSHLDMGGIAREGFHRHYEGARRGIYLAVLGHGDGLGHFLGALAGIQHEGCLAVLGVGVVVGFQDNGVAFLLDQQPFDAFGFEVPVVDGALYREGGAGAAHGGEVEVVLAGDDFGRAVSILGGADGGGEVTGLDRISGGQLLGSGVLLGADGQGTGCFVGRKGSDVVTFRLDFPVGNVGVHIDDGFTAQALEGEGGVLAVGGREEGVLRLDAQGRCHDGALSLSGNGVFLDHFLLHAGRSCHKEAYC